MVEDWIMNNTQEGQDYINGLDVDFENVEPTDDIYIKIKEAAENIAKAQLRKATPVYSGCVAYFPLALKEIAKASVQGQAQHNPDEPLAWDRSKSGDELDAMMRHLIDHASGEVFDDCGTRHIVKCGWRILAFIQKTMEDEK